MKSYDAQVIEVIDGDTVLLYIDLGFFVSISRTLRLTGIDLMDPAPPLDIRRDEEAIKWMEKRFTENNQISIEVSQTEDGIHICDIIQGGMTVNQELSRLGLLRGSERQLVRVH